MVIGVARNFLQTESRKLQTDSRLKKMRFGPQNSYKWFLFSPTLTEITSKILIMTQVQSEEITNLTATEYRVIICTFGCLAYSNRIQTIGVG